MPFQGTAADMIKMARSKIEKIVGNKEDIKMLLQVHDELVFEIKKEKVKLLYGEIKNIMENVVDLKVPVIADVSIGANWAN